MQTTGIEWCDYSANLLKYRDHTGKAVWHCEKTSPGCRSCYAEAIAQRFGRGGPFLPVVTPDVTPFFDEAEALKLLRSKKLAGKRVFVDDMTDMFGSWVLDEIIDRHFAVFALRPDVTFQVLTKRPERMAAYWADGHRNGRGEHTSMLVTRALRPVANELGIDAARLDELAYAVSGDRFPPNVWAGTSCEDQRRADERIPHLLRVPAAVRFLSAEPLLGPVNLTTVGVDKWDVLHGWKPYAGPSGANTDRVDWVIVGGESGAGARPCDIAWIRSILDQCREAEVPIFVKQLGSRPYVRNAMSDVFRCFAPNNTFDDARGFNVLLKDKKGGDWSEWSDRLRVREFPATAGVTP